MNHSEMVDSLVNKLEHTEYSNDLGVGCGTSTVLSRYQKAETIATKQAIAEWLQDNINDDYIENQILKQRVKFLEEMVSKSNFKPFIEELTQK